MKSDREYLVYILYLKNKICYVGHTSNIEKRLDIHRAALRKFDRHSVVKKFRDKKGALLLEKELQRKHLPKPKTIAINTRLPIDAISLWHKYGLEKRLNKEQALADIIYKAAKSVER